VPSTLKVLACATLLVAALAAAEAPPASARTSSKSPCWKALLNDWYDGRIDNTYPKHCYTDALHHLPADVQTYSSAHDDILRALQSAVSKARKSGKAVGPNTLVQPSNRGARRTTAGGTYTTAPGRKPGKGLGGFANKLNPASASSLPIPLLVLGGLAILLVAAGGIGLVARQVQARRHAP
jgi:hypothetical protein